MNLYDLVKDWGGFEELVKDLHNTGDVSIERNVILKGTSGVPRQIDVVIRHSKTPYEYITIIECKYWVKKVERLHIDALYSSMLDLNASKGVFFTTKGYQSGAEIYAKSKGIDIFIIRDLTDEEWGLPGKIIDLYLHVTSKAILAVNAKNTKIAYKKGTEPIIKKGLSISFGNNEKKHIIISNHKKKHKTLEEYIEAASIHAIKEMQKNSFIINNGEECTRYFSIIVNMPFAENNLEVLVDNTLIIIPEIELKVGIKISQSRLIFDRSKSFIYVLAVEDCIKNQLFAISRKKDIQSSNWIKLNKDKNKSSKGALLNGSLVNVVVNGFFDPKEMDGKKEVPFKK